MRSSGLQFGISRGSGLGLVDDVDGDMTLRVVPDDAGYAVDRVLNVAVAVDLAGFLDTRESSAGMRVWGTCWMTSVPHDSGCRWQAGQADECTVRRSAALRRSAVVHLRASASRRRYVSGAVTFQAPRRFNGVQLGQGRPSGLSQWPFLCATGARTVWVPPTGARAESNRRRLLVPPARAVTRPDRCGLGWPTRTARATTRPTRTPRAAS